MIDPQISICRLVTLKLTGVNFKIIDFLGCLYWTVWPLLVREEVWGIALAFVFCLFLNKKFSPGDSDTVLVSGIQ